MAKSFEVKIIDASMQLTCKQKIAMKDTSRAIKLDEVCAEGNEIQIKPTGYVVLSVHNEKSDNTDYEKYVIIDASGEKYITGSKSFWQSFKDIWEEMVEYVDEKEDWSLIIYKKDSKNYKSKQFLTCSIV